MVYLKSCLFGVGGAVLASLLWITATLAMQLLLPYVVARLRGTGGVSSAHVGSDSVLIPALIGFIIAFAWEWYRVR